MGKESWSIVSGRKRNSTLQLEPVPNNLYSLHSPKRDSERQELVPFQSIVLDLGREQTLKRDQAQEGSLEVCGSWGLSTQARQ